MVFTKSSIIRLSLFFTLMTLVITDSLNYLASDGFQFAGGTYLSAFLKYVSIIIFVKIVYYQKTKDVDHTTSVLYKLLMIYLVVSMVRALFVADCYWDNRHLFLTSLTFTLISLVFYLGTMLDITKTIMRFYIKYILIVCVILLPVTYGLAPQTFSRLVLPIITLLLLAPYIKRKWIFFLVSLLVLSVLSNPSFRANLIKIGLSTLILGIFYFKAFRSTIVKRISFISVVCLPIILVVLGLFYDFNIFNELSANDDLAYEVQKIGQGELQTQNNDTRTFLYLEVLNDLANNDAFLFGKSPSQGYRSFAFTDTGGAMNGIRYSTEVNYLNILLYYGIIGLLLNIALVLHVAYLGVFRSKNKLAIMFGFLLLSKYLLSFIEEFTKYDFNFYFFWLIMGLVSSKRFRAMNEHQVKVWVKSIFSERSSRRIYLNNYHSVPNEIQKKREFIGVKTIKY